MSSQILLIGDHVGYGRLAIGAQESVLSQYGHIINFLPSALVSNNFCYGKYAMMLTTDYMKKTLETWHELKFNFNFISIGFLAEDTQAEVLIEFCKNQKKNGTKILVDPIMADNGSLYHGFGQEIVKRLQKMVSVADIIVPNYTEACYLIDNQYKKEGLDQKEVKPFIDKLRTLGAKSIVVTSAKVNNQSTIIGYDSNEDKYITLPYREIPVFFSGTGDIFSGLLIKDILDNQSLETALKNTSKKLTQLIEKHKDYPNKNEGLPF